MPGRHLAYDGRDAATVLRAVFEGGAEATGDAGLGLDDAPERRLDEDL